MRLVSLLAVALAATAHAQVSNWSTLAPALGGSAPVAGGFGAPWETQPGLVVRLESPAYGGHARAEIRLAEVTAPADDDAVPDFVLTAPTVGWGPSADAGPLRLGAGARVGIAQFRFDDRAAGNFQNETELAVGVWGSAALRLGGRVEAWAEADVTRITLADPATLASVSGGLAVRLDTPGWLREVLR